MRTAGTASSLAFTPVQGIELENPDAKKMRLQPAPASRKLFLYCFASYFYTVILRILPHFRTSTVKSHELHFVLSINCLHTRFFGFNKGYFYYTSRFCFLRLAAFFAKCSDSASSIRGNKIDKISAKSCEVIVESRS